MARGSAAALKAELARQESKNPLPPSLVLTPHAHRALSLPAQNPSLPETHYGLGSTAGRGAQTRGGGGSGIIINIYQPGQAASQRSELACREAAGRLAHGKKTHPRTSAKLVTSAGRGQQQRFSPTCSSGASAGGSCALALLAIGLSTCTHCLSGACKLTVGEVGALLGLRAASNAARARRPHCQQCFWETLAVQECMGSSEIQKGGKLTIQLP